MSNQNSRSLPVRFSFLSGMLFACVANALAQEQPAPSDQPASETPATESENHDESSGTQARALLQQCADAIRNANSVSYKIKTYGTDSMESMFAKIDAEVWMLRDTSGVWLMRAKGAGQGRSGDEQTFDVGWRKDTIEYLDFKEKKVTERRTREVRGGAYQISTGSRVADLISNNPYQSILSAEKVELQDRQTVDGVDCDVILASTQAKRSKVRWYFGVEDHLPRKFEKIVDGEKIAGMMVSELREFSARAEPAFGADAVRVQVPSDFAIDRYQPVEQQDSSKAPAEDEKGGKAEPSKTGAFTGIPGAKIDPKVDETKPVTAPAEESKVETPAAEPAPPAVQMIPAFELAGPNGAKVTADSLKGTVTIIDFFGGWMPARTWQSTLKTALGEPSGVKVYAADVREKSAESGAKVLRDRGITWDHLHGADALAKQLGIKVYPAAVVVGKDGRIIEVFQNCRDAAVADRIKTAALEAAK